MDDILNINNIYLANIRVSQIFPAELQLNKANTSEASLFLDLHLFISNDIVSNKIMINVTILILKLSISLFLDSYDPRSTSHGVSISHLIRFAKGSSLVVDVNTRNKLLTQKLLKQGYRYHKLRKTFPKLYR